MCEKFYCDQCKEKLNIVLVDGYGFGDRLLEGVDFIVENVDNKPVVLNVDADSIPYFEQLNKEYWFEVCGEYCEGLDIATCPACGYDVVVWGG